MLDYYNSLYTDEHGRFYHTLYIARNTATNEPVVVYYRLEAKDLILVTPVIDFDHMFKLHDPYSNLDKYFKE